jgi:hypothetical protein
MTNDRTPPGKHYSEPEIIPPGSGDDYPFWPQEIIEERGARRIYITKVGPLGVLSFWLLAGLISVAAILFFFGFLFILIPIAGIVLAAAIVANFLRRPRRWLR